MQILHPNSLNDHSLLDSGGGRKLERFAGYLVSRPEPGAIWNKKLSADHWNQAQAVFIETGKWRQVSPPPRPWLFRYQDLTLELKLTPYKHTGVFPEQAVNWDWASDLITKSQHKPSILNLFAYTGAATLAAAAAGASVCHVDSSQPAVKWAKRNQELSNLADKPIRWMVDDCLKFAEREAKRGVKYDGIIMDPPAFGRDTSGKTFKFDRDLPRLLNICSNLLPDNPLFFLINAYNVGHSPQAIKNLLADILPAERIQCGELHLSNDDISMPCSIFARFS
ncbi:MAG: class I SAM-dependent methyltransferase [Candidatus Edwardsbacteria bacterium]|nr:class I SAM-dependent methyltransferase [Candidatus Edwardsbacteria bacterium]MBU1577576.1 class I SAM-dependent methyltransferase [Candidatus Edwardsbacteria bacterium]MBU2463577.1 class I SAM-dependent methyltransferase [Candidatus Edwardsbacteria bacterium]MBU2593729.1 class I SAM-dependent methyltransferase [Candidatus Edwardsbacteria bacterium]